MTNTPQHPEPFITRQQLADALGISVATVDRYRRAGMPSERWAKRTRRFRLSECVAWLRENAGPEDS